MSVLDGKEIGDIFISDKFDDNGEVEMFVCNYRMNKAESVGIIKHLINVFGLDMEELK